MKEINFYNSIEEHSVVVEDGNYGISFVLNPTYENFEEIYNRATSKEDFDYLLNETLTAMEVTANVALDENLEVDTDSLNVSLSVGFRNYDVPLTDNEKESLLNDMNRYSSEHDMLLKELIKEYSPIEIDREEEPEL